MRPRLRLALLLIAVAGCSGETTVVDARVDARIDARIVDASGGDASVDASGSVATVVDARRRRPAATAVSCTRRRCVRRRRDRIDALPPMRSPLTAP
jgi:hypothetical protein